MASRADDEVAAALAELTQGAARIHVPCPLPAVRKFGVFIRTLLLWGRRTSLTSATTAARIVREHIIDSLHVALQIEAGQRIADIGSGAGFPGIPLAIVCPAARFVLFESRRKRANFLREVVRHTELPNVVVEEEHLEARVTAWSNTFDVTTCRAVGTLDAFLGLSEVLLKTGGRAIAMKGPDHLRHRVQLPDAFTGLATVAYELPRGGERCLVVCTRR
jgi:16S rRNA (guanine527-N7)-methyltransferase